MQKGLPPLATPFLPARKPALGFHPWIALPSDSSLPSLRVPPWNIQQEHISDTQRIEEVRSDDIYDSVTLLREAARREF
jgi:hypothetical protein